MSRSLRQTRRCSPESAFHRWASPSQPAVATVLPSCDQATLWTAVWCRFSAENSDLPLARSHSRTSVSIAAAMCLPTGSTETVG